MEEEHSMEYYRSQEICPRTYQVDKGMQVD